MRSVPIASFYISKRPVSNQQFEAFDPGYERASTSPGDDDPAAGVDLFQARAYCDWYGRVARKPMRLPTAHEWRYACRGDLEGKVCFLGQEEFRDDGGIDAHAWHAGNSGGHVGDIGAKRYNPFGLYGMVGGVWEWVDASGGGNQNVDEGLLFGGSFRTPAARLRCALHEVVEESLGRDDIGFRIVKSMR